MCVQGSGGGAKVTPEVYMEYVSWTRREGLEQRLRDEYYCIDDDDDDDDELGHGIRDADKRRRRRRCSMRYRYHNVLIWRRQNASHVANHM